MNRGLLEIDGLLASLVGESRNAGGSSLSLKLAARTALRGKLPSRPRAFGASRVRRGIYPIMRRGSGTGPPILTSFRDLGRFLPRSGPRNAGGQ